MPAVPGLAVPGPPRSSYFSLWQDVRQRQRSIIPVTSTWETQRYELFYSLIHCRMKVYLQFLLGYFKSKVKEEFVTVSIVT